MGRERIDDAVTKGRIEEGIKVLTDYKDVVCQVGEGTDGSEDDADLCNLKDYSRLCWEWATEAIHRLLKK